METNVPEIRAYGPFGEMPFDEVQTLFAALGEGYHVNNNPFFRAYHFVISCFSDSKLVTVWEKDFTDVEDKSIIAEEIFKALADLVDGLEFDTDTHTLKDSRPATDFTIELGERVPRTIVQPVVVAWESGEKLTAEIEVTKKDSQTFEWRVNHLGGGHGTASCTSNAFFQARNAIIATCISLKKLNDYYDKARQKENED